MKQLISIAVILLLSSSIAFAQDFCKGDFDYNGMVDANDVITFLNEFGRSHFHNPCPPDGPAPISKSGHTTSWTPRDDGDLQTGVAWPNLRFTDNGDGTVTDNLTGLIWLKDANCFGNQNWWDALTDSNGLNSGECGLTDGSIPGEWRLPQIKELHSLIDFGNVNPALPSGHPFTNVQSDNYWSSTGLVDIYEGAWYVILLNGDIFYNDKIDNYHVWPVRGGR